MKVFSLCGGAQFQNCTFKLTIAPGVFVLSFIQRLAGALIPEKHQTSFRLNLLFGVSFYVPRWYKLLQTKKQRLMNEPRVIFCHMKGNRLVSPWGEKVTASLAALPPNEFPFHCMWLLQPVTLSGVFLLKRKRGSCFEEFAQSCKCPKTPAWMLSILW